MTDLGAGRHQWDVTVHSFIKLRRVSYDTLCLCRSTDAAL